MQDALSKSGMEEVAWCSRLCACISAAVDALRKRQAPHWRKRAYGTFGASTRSTNAKRDSLEFFLLNFSFWIFPEGRNISYTFIEPAHQFLRILQVSSIGFAVEIAIEKSSLRNGELYIAKFELVNNNNNNKIQSSTLLNLSLNFLVTWLKLYLNTNTCAN